MFFSGGLIPFFLIIKLLGLYDTYALYLIPCMYSVYHMIILSNYFAALPEELREAAILDGTNIFQRMFLITLPNIKAIIVFIAVNAFFGAWNDIMGPLMYITSDEHYTVNLYIYYTYLTTEIAMESRPNEQMAIGVLLMLPMVVVFIFYQNTMIEGFSFAGIKA